MLRRLPDTARYETAEPSTQHDNSGTFYWIDQTAAVSIAIPQSFDEAAQSCSAYPAQRQAVESGDLWATRRAAGAAMSTRLQLIPHCHGTHTESVAHIVNDRFGGGSNRVVRAAAPLDHRRARPLGETEDDYPGGKDDDRVITQASIEKRSALGTIHSTRS